MIRGRRCLCRHCIPYGGAHPDHVMHPAYRPALARLAVERGLTVAYPPTMVLTAFPGPRCPR